MQDYTKAPGPDGFSSLFLKRAWSIVGSEVCDAVADFFSSGCLLREINCIIIASVPKVPNPSSMHDYRPISFVTLSTNASRRLSRRESSGAFQILLALLKQLLFRGVA